MSIQAVAWAISQRVGSPTGKVLLMCLANYANEHGECWPSQKTISKEAELGERATRDWLKKLEQAGFIERHRRNRNDGSRTSDLIILNLSKKIDTAPETLTADNAARPNQAAAGSQPNGTSHHPKRHEMPDIEPSVKPSKEPSTGAQAHGGNGFNLFWEEWPSKDRPRKRQAARWSFERLSHDDQAKAVKYAKDFRRLSKAREDVALMIPYLKDSSFQELVDAPELNVDGKFVFTPERAEWSSWIDYLKLEYSAEASGRIEKLGKFIDARRWPPKPSSETSRLAS